MEKICYCNIIRILYVVQRQKRIFRGQFQSCHCSESIFSVDSSFQAVDDIFSKSDINKIGNVFENKRIMNPIHDSCWPYAWVCKFLSWILLKNNMRSMSYGNFPEREAKRASFSHLAPHLPSVGRGSLTQMKAVNTSSYSIFLREINYAHDLIKLFLLLLIE